MARKRRTKKAYQDLYNDPTTLFKGVNTILFPNGVPEIWFQSTDGRRSIKLTVSDGPAGLGLQIDRSIGGAPLTVAGNLADEVWTPSAQQDFVGLFVTQYRPDEWSQKFKAWCAAPTDGAGYKTTEYPGDVPADRD